MGRALTSAAGVTSLGSKTLILSLMILSTRKSPTLTLFCTNSPTARILLFLRLSVSSGSAPNVLFKRIISFTISIRSARRNILFSGVLGRFISSR